MKNYLLIACITAIFQFFYLATHAQKHKVEGIVADQSGLPLSSASIVLLNAQDSVLLGFGVSDDKGRFRIIDVDEGQYVLRASYLGFSEYYVDISTDPANKNIDIGTLLLQPSDIQLGEVTVKAYQVPIIMKRDTIEYNAAAFKTAPNAAVEDLLKRMPGIEVGKNGSIKAQGEQVNQVLVEGKEFFGNDPTVATKNLPADIVDKVQVFDKKSEMAEFSGIDDGQEQKTINLALKEGKKGGFFGKGTAGYGTSDRYEGKFNINRFGKKSQISAIGMANNINEQGFSIMDYIDFMGGLGNMMSSGGGGGEFRISSGDLGVPLGAGFGSGFVDTKAAGLNYNNDLSERTELSGSYFFSRIKNDIDQTTLREGQVQDGAYSTNSNSHQITTQLGHTLNLTLKNKIDTTQWLTLRSSFSWNDGEGMTSALSSTIDEDNILQNEFSTANQSFSDRMRLNINGTYNKRLGRKGRIFSAQFNFGNRENLNESLVNSLNRFYTPLPSESFVDTINQEQFQNNDQMDYRVGLSYTEPLGKRRYLELNYTRQNYQNDFDKEFYDIIFQPERQRLINNLLSNSYNRQYQYDRIGLNLKVNRRKYAITAGFQLQNSNLNGELGESLIQIDKNFFNLLPSLRYKYDFNNANNLSLYYYTSIREPSIEELQPTVDNSNPLYIYQGNPNLRPEYSHRMRLNYHSFSQFTNIAFFTGLNATYTRNKIVNSQRIDDNFVQYTQPINVSKDWILDGYISFSSPLRFADLKLNVGSDLFYNNGILFLNNEMTTVNRWNTSYDISIENRKKDKWDWIIGTDVSYNLTKYKENTDLNQDYVQLNYYADFSLESGKGWYFNTAMDYSIYSNESFGSQTKIPIWQASISKTFLKGQKGQLKFAVIDILDKNKGIDRISDLNYLQESRILTLARYFMASFSYSFSGFGNEDKGVIHIDSRRRR